MPRRQPDPAGFITNSGFLRWGLITTNLTARNQGGDIFSQRLTLETPASSLDARGPSLQASRNLRNDRPRFL